MAVGYSFAAGEKPIHLCYPFFFFGGVVTGKKEKGKENHMRCYRVTARVRRDRPSYRIGLPLLTINL